LSTNISNNTADNAIPKTCVVVRLLESTQCRFGSKSFAATSNQFPYPPLLSYIWASEATVAETKETRLATREGSRKTHRTMAGRHPLLEINDPKPVANLASVWRTASQAATIGIFVVIFIAAIDQARALLLPATSAFVIGMMLGPLSRHAKEYGVPTIITAVVLWLLVIAIFYGVIVLLSAPAIDWIKQAPEIGHNIKEKLQVLNEPLASLQALRNAILPESGKLNFGFDIASVVQPMLIIVTPAIGQIFIFFGTLFFFLLGRAQLRHVLIVLFEDRESRLRTLKILNDIEHNLTNYLSVVAMINLCVGVAAGLIAYFVGLPNVIAWGILAFILNFIPYIGALIMESVQFAVGLVTFPTLTYALLAPLLYLGFSTLEGHFITPSIMGRRLTLNPLIVFLALIFWTWLWGPMGAFLAVPLLIVALTVTNHLFPQDEPILPG
jgi:predicted PurR-regulated permease PerM